MTNPTLGLPDQGLSVTRYRPLQNIVLLRPSQENLCRAAAQINRHRDQLAPSSLTDDQLEGIRDSDRIRRLQEKGLALKKEMRALYGTLKKAKSLNPDRFKEHEVVVRELARVRAVHRREKRSNLERITSKLWRVSENTAWLTVLMILASPHRYDSGAP